jgi:hypothetical protein
MFELFLGRELLRGGAQSATHRCAAAFKVEHAALRSDY